MTVIYLDSVFLLNAIMDYLLFLSAAMLAGIPLRRKRYICAAVLGGVYSIAIFLPGLDGLATLPAKAAAGMLLGLIAFGRENQLWKLLLLTLAVACGMAGSVLGLSLVTGFQLPMVGGVFYTNMDASTILLASAGAYLVFQMVLRSAARHGLRGEILRVIICVNGMKREIHALWDSGNGLVDPLDHQPVLIVAPGVIEEMLPKNAACLLTRSALMRPAELMEDLLLEVPFVKPRLLPYQAVGIAGGLLVAIRCDWAEINGRYYEKLLLALSPNTLGDGYSALWGGECGNGGRYETLEMVEALAGKVAAQRGIALHWWQRHTSVAVGTGTRSRITGAAGGRRRPIGTDRT